MKKKIGSLLIFTFSCLILSGFIMNFEVKAEGGSTGSGDGSEAGDVTCDCSSWPYKGKINGKSTPLRGVRITIVDNDGKVKPGTKSVDYVKNTGVSELTANYSATKTTKTMYLQHGSSLVWKHGKVSFKYDKNIANNIISNFGDSNGGNMGTNIRNLYNNYVNGQDLAKTIVDTIYKDTCGSGCTISGNDVILFEPITYVKYCSTGICDSSASSYYIYGTAYELNAKYSGGNKYGGGAITGHVAKALYFKGDKISSLTDIFAEPKDTSAKYPGKELTKKNGWGMGALWIGKMAKKCDVNVNNNIGDDKKYNWTESYKCDADGDGNKNETCWRKITGGCCDQVTLTNDILNKYPECGSCKPSNIEYLNGKEVSSLDAITCDNNDKKITNYRGTGRLSEVTPKYCLANNNLVTGVINGKRYGCEITDSLLLPKEYGDNLSIGQYFVWPTSKTLQKLGNFDMRYPVARTSEVRCVAYTYTSDGKLQYATLSENELNLLETKFKVKGNLKLIYNGGDNGKIIEESSNSDFKNGEDNLFTGKINTVYTLEKIDKTNGVYAYYDQEKLQYTNTIIISKINKYIQYGFPIIPFGNHGDKNVNIKYGINFDDVGMPGLNSYSGSYICGKNKSKPSRQCVCPPGTLHEGLDLTPYFVKPYDSWSAECARVSDLKCDDPDTRIKCPNDDSKDMTNCVRNKIYGGATEKEAYDLCVAHDCGCTGDDCKPEVCTGTDCDKGLDIIYRPIFLNNPFPSIKGTKRVAGANWGGKNSLNKDGLGTKYITSTASKMYQGQAMYSFTLTPKALRDIKKYNSSHGYDDFEMTCGKNQYCISNVLRGEFSEYFTGGTCQLQTNAKVRGRNDCRLTALER